MSRLGAELSYSDPSRAVGLLDEAVAAARALADDATLARTLFERSIAISGPDSLEDELADCDELLQLAIRMGDDQLVMMSHRSRANCLLTQGETTALDQEIEAIRQLVARRAAPPDRALIASLDGMRALLEGRFVQAEAFARRSLDWALRSPDPASLAKAGGQLAILFLQSGQFEKLGGVMEQLDARFPDHPMARCGRARFESAASRPERARGIFETLAARGFSTIPRDASFLTTMALLSEVCRALGDTHRGAQLYELLRPYHALSSSLAGLAFYGSISHHLGGLAALLSEPAAATAHFEEALATHSRMGARPWLAHTQHDFARLLLDHGEASDRDRALQLAGDASATARELGLPGLAERAEALQQEIQGAIPLRPRQRRSPL